MKNFSIKKIKKTAFLLIFSLFFVSQAVFADSLRQFNDDMQRVASEVLPTVVSISSQKGGGTSGFGLFGSPQRGQALGSGVIIDKRGYIVTNYHVVEGASDITVTLSDKREFKTEIVGVDPSTDLAVIKIKGSVPSNLPVIIIADSDKIRPGQVAIAVGNAFGFSNTITMGIVSAVNRDNLGLLDYESLIQTDAAINPGNSGGALVNIDGHLIGINTAIYSRSGGSNGLGFAIPANQVTSISQELIKNGKIVRGWIGVLIQDITEEMKEQMKLAVSDGVLVTQVESGSPARTAGIKENDIIVQINRKKIKDVNSLRNEVADMKPGVSVVFGIIRDGKNLNITVKVGKMPEKNASLEPEFKKDLGIVASDIDEKLSYDYRISDRNGVIITSVSEGTPAQSAGLAPGDVIKSYEGEAVVNLEQYSEYVDRFTAHSRIELLITRRGEQRLVTIQR